MATVPPTPRTNRITLASPSAGPFEVGFRLFESDGLKVYVDGIGNTDFTVSATYVNGYDDAAEITFGTTLATSTVIQIDGGMTPAREDDFINGPQLTQLMNIEQGRVWAVLSELKMRLDRAVLGLSDVGAGDAADAGGRRIKNVGEPTESDDAVRLQDVQDVVSAGGNVPAPVVDQIGYILEATGVGAFAWRSSGLLNNLGTVSLFHDCGQSNSVGLYPTDAAALEPLDRAPAGVKVWDSVDAGWKASSWKGLPWTRSAPHGSGLVTGCPNIGLSFAIRVQEIYGGTRYLSHNARSGRSIEDWVSTGATSSMYAEDKAKIEAALATPELSGVTKIAGVIRTQSEEDYNKVFDVGDTFPLLDLATSAEWLNSYEVYRTYKACLELYLDQLKAESWWGPESVLILVGNSELHQRYMPIKAMRDFAQLHPEVLFVSAKGMMTREDLADFTHFDGPSIDELGYKIAFAEFEQRFKPGDIAQGTGSFMQNRVGEPYQRGDDTIVFPPETVLDASLKKIAATRGTTKTIAAGVITVDGSYFAVDTEGAASTDNLDTINGGVDGQVLLLRAASSSRDIVLTQSGNLILGATTRTLTANTGRIELHYDSTVAKWTEVGFADASSRRLDFVWSSMSAMAGVASLNAGTILNSVGEVQEVIITFDRVSLDGVGNIRLRVAEGGIATSTGYTQAAALSGTLDTSTDGFYILAGNASRALSGIIHLRRLSSTLWRQDHSMTITGGIIGTGSGYVVTAGEISGFTIQTTAGLYDGSSGMLYGYR